MRWVSAPWALPFFCASVALMVLAQAGIFEEPILVDRAYFAYLGQALLRGEPIYTQTFFYYPPLGPLVSAASMAIGRLFDVPTYLAARFTSVLIGTASAALMYELCRGATRSRWSALIGAFALTGFGVLTSFVLATLEPKLLVLFFTLVAAVAVQRRRWGIAGLASGAALISWQPGGLVGLACAATLISSEGARRSPAIRRFAFGVAMGMLPAVVYLTLSGTWWGFWQRAALFPLQGNLHLSARPEAWLNIMQKDFGNEIVVFAAAALGFGWFALHSARKGMRGGLGVWLAPDMGGMPLLAAGWIAFNTREFQGWADMVPILPIVAFWMAWACDGALTGLRTLALRLWGRDRGVRIAHLGAAGLTAAFAVYAFTDAWHHTPGMTLQEEQALVAQIMAPVGPNDEVVAYGASEIYVLTDRPSPNGFLNLNRFFLPVSHTVGLNGCEGVWERLIAQQPAVVVINRWGFKTVCFPLISRGLRALGYTESVRRPRLRQNRSYFPNPRDIVEIRWLVYSRAGSLDPMPAPRRTRAGQGDEVATPPRSK